MPKTKVRKEKPTWGPKDWTPVLKGPVYCSPACGHGCTIQEYLTAEKAAKKLAERMGAGWTYRVSENMKWYYCVISPCQRISVFPNDYGGKIHSYCAFLGERSPYGGSGRWAEHGDTPEEAVNNTVKKAQQELDKVGAIVLGLPEYEKKRAK